MFDVDAKIYSLRMSIPSTECRFLTIYQLP